jgi:hypothetical protein
LLALLGAHHILHVSRVKVKTKKGTYFPQNKKPKKAHNVLTIKTKEANNFPRINTKRGTQCPHNKYQKRHIVSPQ